MEAIEAPGVGHEPEALGLEHGPDRLVRDLGVAVSLGIGHALVEEPGVELVVALEPEARREEALAHQPEQRCANAFQVYRLRADIFSRVARWLPALPSQSVVP